MLRREANNAAAQVGQLKVKIAVLEQRIEALEQANKKQPAKKQEAKKPASKGGAK